MEMHQIGKYAFLIGVAIAIIAGFASAPINGASGTTAGYVMMAVVVLGLVVGFLNVTGDEMKSFLLATIAVVLMGTANLSAIPVAGQYLENMVLNVAAFVAPAALVVGLKSVYNLSARPTPLKK